jgi:uncharacterized protein YqeY
MMFQKLKSDLTEALKAKDTLRLTVLRGIVTAFTNENVAKKRKPDTILSDDEVLTVLMRASKQRKDSIEQFEKGGRSDLAQNEIKELEIIQAYLPTLMSEAEVRTFVETKKTELNFTDATKKGQFVGMMMRELKGRADGSLVKATVDSLFV